MNTEYGGELRNTRKGRLRARPISTVCGMHLVLKTSLAKGPWSFRKHLGSVEEILGTHRVRNRIHFYGTAILTNHIHLYVKFPSEEAYHCFVSAVCGAIALAVRGNPRPPWPTPFWDQRVYSRVVCGEVQHQRMLRYIRLNQLEALGLNRTEARAQLQREFP